MQGLEQNLSESEASLAASIDDQQDHFETLDYEMFSNNEEVFASPIYTQYQMLVNMFSNFYFYSRKILMILQMEEKLNLVVGPLSSTLRIKN